MATKQKSGGLGALSNAELHGLFAVQARKMEDAAKKMMAMLTKNDCADFYAASKRFELPAPPEERTFIKNRNDIFDEMQEIMSLMETISTEQEEKLGEHK